MSAGNFKLDLKKATVTIEGLSTLVCNRPPTSPDYDRFGPEEQFRESLFPIVEGKTYGIPKNYISKALVGVGGKQMAEIVTIDVLDELVPISGSAPRIRTERVNRNGVRTFIYIGQFFPWEIVVPCEVDIRRIGIDELVDLFNAAGFRMGIGEGRPSTGGQSGKFRVKQYQISEESRMCVQQSARQIPIGSTSLAENRAAD